MNNHPFDTGSPLLARRAIDDAALLSGPYWGELRTFLAVAKAKSLNRAAEELGVSRMTAAREVQRLHDVTGSQLVVFSKSGAALTEKGADLVATLLKFDRDIHAITTDLRAEAKHTEGTVRLSITEGLAAIFLIPALDDLTRHYPHLRIQIKNPQNYLSLQENQTDMMIGFKPERRHDIHSVRLGSLHYLPMASRGYVRKYGLPTLDNLCEHRFIDSDRYAGRDGLWAPWRKIVEQGTIAHSCDFSISYGMMLKAGLGVGLAISINLIQPSAVILDLDCRITLPLYLTALTERLQARPARVAFDFIASVFSGHNNAWLADELNVDVAVDAPESRGYRMLFNL
jgi:DNA-binding transcriptional LysR family regulator